MAQNYVCDLCNEVAADFMITVIQDGSVQAIGVECLLDWALPIADAFAQAQQREAAQAETQPNPATQHVSDYDPPDMPVIAPTDGPDGPIGPQTAPGGDTEGGEATGPPRGRKRGGHPASEKGTQDSQTAAAPHVAG